ncbi:hypothetical protein WHR41_04520 [Cladosporium halotolerans]|uniref:Uncharacterized protein n=1 Tax=Cladosporium halotolerans TaxID=1052096 RepID=A0AB34KS73_9PEZI
MHAFHNYIEYSQESLADAGYRPTYESPQSQISIYPEGILFAPDRAQTGGQKREAFTLWPPFSCRRHFHDHITAGNGQSVQRSKLAQFHNQPAHPRSDDPTASDSSTVNPREQQSTPPPLAINKHLSLIKPKTPHPSNPTPLPAEGFQNP